VYQRRSVLLAGLIGLIVLLSGAVPLSQAPAAIRLAVAAGERIRSDSVALVAGEELQVRLEAQPGGGVPLVNVYVHAQDGELVGRDDPDATSDVFTWRAPRNGSYYLLAENTGNGAGVVVATRRAAAAVTRGERSTYATVRVFFATDRQVVGNTPARFFGTEPSSLSQGYCDVSVPRDHRLGELEGPSILRLELRADPEKHVVVLRVQPESAAEFSRAVSARVASSARKEALLFVHGFNVSFEDAVRRAAQMSYDLAFDGPVVVFSWPSQAGPLVTDYRKDERNAELSADNLRNVILGLLQGPGPVTLHVIAHSMGNRVLSSALQQIAATSTTSPRLRQVAMVAPDIDAELFRRAAGKLASMAERVTLYASAGDAALRLSQGFAGYARAGQGGSDVMVVPGIDTVDASSVDTSLLGLGHSYYADNSTILSDLFALLRGRPPSERFGLSAVDTPRGSYWRFRTAAR
jgi:esterase/lipase superfamily enzyme